MCDIYRKLILMVSSFLFKVAKTEAKQMLTPTTPVKGRTPATMTITDDENQYKLGEVTSDIMRMQKVKNKLNSVLVSDSY